MNFASKRPDSLWSQQKLPSWQPIINVKTMWKYLIFIGLVFTLLGVALVLVLIFQPNEIRLPYVDAEGEGSCQACACCTNTSPSHQASGNKPKCELCGNVCNCNVTFTVSTSMKLPVYVYYELDNYYQNHRRYVNSRDDKQLLGLIFPKSKPSENCKNGYRSVGDQDKKWYYPCGAIANSFFTDRFALSYDPDGIVKLDESDIIWKIEKDFKYRRPKGINFKALFNETKASKEVKLFNEKFSKPRSWSDEVWKEWWKEGGVENPHFINWMHPAPISKFRKLYAIIQPGSGCKNEKNGGKDYLCSGNYKLHITYRYSVARWGVPKSVIFSTTEFWGTQKTFLAYFTLGFGVLCILIGIAFFALNKIVKVKIHPHFEDLQLADSVSVSTSTDQSLMLRSTPAMKKLK